MWCALYYCSCSTTFNILQIRMSKGKLVTQFLAPFCLRFIQESANLFIWTYQLADIRLTTVYMLHLTSTNWILIGFACNVMIVFFFKLASPAKYLHIIITSYIIKTYKLGWTGFAALNFTARITVGKWPNIFHLSLDLSVCLLVELKSIKGAHFMS